MREGLVGGVLTGFIALVMMAVPALASECREDRVQLRSAQGTAAFTVEIADTDAERAQGLMHVASMPRFNGMLFVFDRPQRAVFWMENTLIPLDMLFIDEQGVVQAVHENAVPLDRTPIDGGEGIRYVLEINGGMASRLHLAPGAELRHPAIAQDLAAWPCE
ncbi:DUF192 domain-containing protein [Pararhodobacter aggregans]|uniref:DUF192 domain-containing protein n=1 Tax=Pararhodobacter aggregans TaxID=404875 RepID=A0A2T7UXW7_9RHOB|nr:DUF192 domain-containing protein [Pararhodobacter aggregans]PTX05077.1 hypothetical protein C8N33_101490 [Pararhodobacter aggregans]PVE49388.1 hypothetical protein DDE23_03010 [Pararhodobacter aggregans]